MLTVLTVLLYQKLTALIYEATVTISLPGRCLKLANKFIFVTDVRKKLNKKPKHTLQCHGCAQN